MCPVQGLTEAFVVQTLGGQCIAGRQWGWGSRGISVTAGCCAVFGYRTAYARGPAPGYVAPPRRPGLGGGAVQTVNCASMNYQYARCPMDTRNGVTIGMITNQPCRHRATRGWDRNGASASGQIIECNSWRFQPARCPARTRNGVSMVRVMGGTCDRNRTWGWDENGIWVNGGCRARFRLN